MHWYLESTADAVKGLFEVVAVEHMRMAELKNDYSKALSKHEFFYKDFATADLSEDFDDYQIMHKFSKAAQAGEDANAARLKLDDFFKRRIEARVSSHAVLCGALLQIAKQGLSLEFGPPDKIPDGRRLGSTPIRDVIWEGRNQSMHFEEDRFKKKLRDTFTQLEADFGQQFRLVSSPSQQRTLASEIVELLGWWDYENYLKDMTALLESGTKSEAYA